MSIPLWLGLGFILTCLEFIIPTILFIFFGFSAFVIALILFLGIDISLGYQLIIFGTLSISTVLLFRKKLKNLSKTKINEQTKSVIDFKNNINQYASVVSKFNESSSLGRIYMNGVEWNAKSIDNESFEINEVVEVVGNEGITVLIKKANKQEKK